MEDVASTYKQLSEDDLRILLGIETGMRYHRWVPIEELQKYTRLNKEKLQFKLTKLGKKGLVHRNLQPYEGYRIYFEAYDLLALNTFVKRNTLSAIGGVIGVGKESIVYAARGGILERELVIKFHREGKTSFKQVRRARSHIGERKHLSWVYASRLAAQREYEALTALYPKVSVPEPIDHNRHAILMELRHEEMLVNQQLEQPQQYLSEILHQIHLSYTLGFVHADLSEFNILTQNDKIVLIDWPQSVRTSEPNAIELLERDLSNVLKFFKRKYNIEQNTEETLNQIRYSQNKFD
jgi:RIO kinase 2